MATTITGWRRFASIEPLAFALTFSFSISDNVMTDLIVYQTCRTTASLNQSECDILHENSSSKEAMHIEKLVQPHAGFILILKSCIETIFPTILSLFLGPWSDKFGRKPLLFFPFIGYILNFGLLACLSSLDINTYWFLLPSIPSAILGGLPALLLTFLCYITDITDNENRAWHIAYLEAMLSTGILAGLFVGSFVFNEYGYVAVFSISAVLCLLAVLFIYFLIIETVHYENERTVKSLFDCSLVKELFTVITKKRDGFDRFLVWCCISAIVLHVVTLQGNGSILLLFASSKLGWNITDLSIYSATHLLISIIGMMLLIKLVVSILQLPDTVVIYLSCISSAIACLIKAFVTKPWHMYLSSSIGMFSASAVPVIRAIMSKVIPQTDVGKVFSLTTIMEMIVPFATTPLYIFIYTHTLNNYPCPVWFLSTILLIFTILLVIIVNQRWKKLKDFQYTQFHGEPSK